MWGKRVPSPEGPWSRRGQVFHNDDTCMTTTDRPACSFARPKNVEAASAFDGLANKDATNENKIIAPRKKFGLFFLSFLFCPFFETRLSLSCQTIFSTACYFFLRKLADNSYYFSTLRSLSEREFFLFHLKQVSRKLLPFWSSKRITLSESGVPLSRGNKAVCFPGNKHLLRADFGAVSKQQFVKLW